MLKNIFLVLLSASTALAQTWVSSNDREIVVKSVNVITMENDQVLKDQTVVVKNGLISAIGKNPSYAKDALVIDAKGKYLIPGLAEMHAHIAPIDDIEPMKETLLLFAYNGITTIRGMLGHPRHLELRAKINSGEIIGPRFYTTGPSLNGFSVKTAEAGEEAVKKQKEAGYDFLKLHPGLTKETFGAISKTANEVNIPFAGHVSFGVGVWRAIEAGYSSIDHLDGFVEGLVPGIEQMNEQQVGSFGMYVADEADATKIPTLMNELKKKNVSVVPTQSLAERWFSPDFDEDAFRNDPEAKYMTAKVVDQWISSRKNVEADARFNAEEITNYVKFRRKLILECQKSGVRLLLGCDAPQVFNVPGFSTHHELAYLVDSGLTPYQALQTGTVNVAQYLSLNNTGMIKTGFVADMILLEKNPLEDIHNTLLIQGVFLSGKWLSKDGIAEGLQKLQKQ